MGEHATQNPRRLRWTPELVRKFWDHESRNAEHYFTQQFGRAIVAAMGPHLRGRARILDYGCGAGALIGHLLDSGYYVTGLDTSPESVRAVNARYEERAGFLGAYLPSELESSTFDAVTCCEVVEHLYDEDLSMVLDQIRGLVERGGVAIFTTPNREDLAANEVYCPVSDVVFHRWQHVRSWDANSLSQVLDDHGLRPVATRETDFSATWSRSWRHAARVRMKELLGRTESLPHLLVAATR